MEIEKYYSSLASAGTTIVFKYNIYIWIWLLPRK